MGLVLARHGGELDHYSVAVTGLSKHGSHLEAVGVRRLAGALRAEAMPAEVSWGCGSGDGLSKLSQMEPIVSAV